MKKSKDLTREEVKERNRKKIQALLNLGFIILSECTREEIDKANKIVDDLDYHSEFILTVPDETCLCLKVSGMILKLLKPYLKDLFYIEQKATGSIYVLFESDEDIIEQLEPLRKGNKDIQLVDSFEIVFKATTLPNFTNRANLYTVKQAPILAQKEIKKILELHARVVNNQNNYFLLSNHVTHVYNMPTSILRILSENVFSLKSLNVLELIMIYASNSSALFRSTNEEIKPFKIPIDFFKHEDFELNQSVDNILNSLKELRQNKLIAGFELVEEAFIINAPIIVKSIKQWSYRRYLHHYRELDIHQRSYVYTFLDYLRYVMNIKYTKVEENSQGIEVQTVSKAERLTISIEGLLYQLELEDYIHDHTHLAKIFNVLREHAIRQSLISFIEPITANDIKRLISFRCELGDLFKLNNIDVPELKTKTSISQSYYNEFGRNIPKR